jgi:hypothetical protein
MTNPHEIMSQMMGMDANNEILSLWYEVSYLRFILINVVNANGLISSKINSDVLENARKSAQDFVLRKFPKLGVTFPETTQENENPQEKE